MESVKSYVSPKIEIGESDIHGFGMFAQSEIKKGEIVYVKGGHIVKREDLFTSRYINSYLPISDGLFIGAKSEDEEETIKLYNNHSCEPNCGLRGEITFVAMRDIKPGEEVTCDYAMIDNEDYEFECYCKTPSCRKKISGYDWMIKELQLKYSGYFARYLADKISENK